MHSKGTSSAGSKVILFGEHFAVYHCPAIALPFASCGVSVRVKSSDSDTVTSTLYSGLLIDSPSLFKGLKELIYNLKEYFKIKTAVSVEIDSNIPLQRGMGSSAAISIAIIKSFYDFIGMDVDEAILRTFASTAEGIHHSNASGIDIETILSDQAIRFVKGDPVQVIRSNIDGKLLLVDSGIKGSTSEAVLYVKSLFDSDSAKKEQSIYTYKKIYEDAIIALEQGDAQTLGQLMSLNHELLKSINISHPFIDQQLSVSMKMGALGGKITGGGLGGCFIVLTTTQKEMEIKDYYESQGLSVYSINMKGLSNEENR